jgi:hypothetical protein
MPLLSVNHGGLKARFKTTCHTQIVLGETKKGGVYLQRSAPAVSRNPTFLYPPRRNAQVADRLRASKASKNTC